MVNVYVISKGAHDYKDAKIFGNIVFLSDEPFDPLGTNNMFKKFWLHLKDSNPDDIILVTGLPVMVGVASAIMGTLHGKVNFLLYRHNGYFVRTIKIKQGE